MFDIGFKIHKSNTIVKDIRDIYNDIDIMTTNPPYPCIPEKIGNFYDKNNFEIEIIEYLGEDGNTIDYRIGRANIVSFTDPDLYNAISKWNKYCYNKLKEDRITESKQSKKQINYILFGIFAFFAIFGKISALIVISVLYFIWNNIIYNKVEEKFVQKAKEDFDLMIEGGARNYSSYDIKIAMSIPKYEIKEQKKIDDKIVLALNNALQKINSIEDKSILMFTYNNNYINGDVSLYNIITEIKKNYKKREEHFINSQLSKDIIHYSNNFISLLDLISQYKNKSKEIDKEITNTLSNYYSIFIYFNNVIVGNDEIVDISKLKFLGQDAKLYKDYIDIK